jgi:hypothetical protein
MLPSKREFLLQIATQLKFSCEITVFIAGNCDFTKKINIITYKTDKNANIFVILLGLFVFLMILFVNSLLKQPSTQLPAMKAVISHENF